MHRHGLSSNPHVTITITLMSKSCNDSCLEIVVVNWKAVLDINSFWNMKFSVVGPRGKRRRQELATVVSLHANILKDFSVPKTVVNSWRVVFSPLLTIIMF